MLDENPYASPPYRPEDCFNYNDNNLDRIDQLKKDIDATFTTIELEDQVEEDALMANDMVRLHNQFEADVADLQSGRTIKTGGCNEFPEHTENVVNELNNHRNYFKNSKRPAKVLKGIKLHCFAIFRFLSDMTIAKVKPDVGTRKKVPDVIPTINKQVQQAIKYLIDLKDKTIGAIVFNTVKFVAEAKDVQIAFDRLPIDIQEDLEAALQLQKDIAAINLDTLADNRYKTLYCELKKSLHQIDRVLALFPKKNMSDPHCNDLVEATIESTLKEG